jgi:hypothetical protein
MPENATETTGTKEKPPTPEKLFNSLTRQITEEESDIFGTNRDRLAGIPEYQDKIDKIIETSNPEELARTIFANPPEVFVYDINDPRKPPHALEPRFVITPPQEEDETLMESELSLPDNLNSLEARVLENGFDLAKRFLKAPRINDGFKDHDNERRPWERRVSAVLDIITQREQATKNRRRTVGWDSTFKKTLCNNQYATSSSFVLLSSYMTLEDSSPGFFPAEMTDDYKRLKEIRKDADDKPDLAADETAKFCRNFIDHFRKK